MLPRVPHHSLPSPVSPWTEFSRSAALIAFSLAAVIPGARAGSSETPPDVPPVNELLAPRHEVPSGIGTLLHQATWTEAGAYWIEADTYDADAQTARLSFTIRKASDRTEIYSLKSGRDFSGLAAGAPFSDGQLLAFRVHAAPESAATVQIRDLATGALRFSLVQPGARSGDSFGQNVWFTSDRILIAASGRDWIQRDSGTIYLYERATGRYRGMIGTGAKNARFGQAPSAAAEGGEQPLGVPYVQVSGKHALIVHGRKAYLFDGIRLAPLIVPPNGLNRVSVREAFITANRVVLSTSESLRGYSRPGRILGYELSTRRLRYQLRAAAFDGLDDFPSRITAGGTRLYVLNALVAGYLPESRAALHTLDLASGRKLATRELPASRSVDSRALSLSVNRLWLRVYQPWSGTGSKADWQAFDPESLEPLLTLTPPGEDRFAGGAPVALPDGRLAVVATRRTTNHPWPMPITIGAAPSSSRSVSGSVIIINDPFTSTTAGVLIYDLQNSGWTHRLLLENEHAYLNGLSSQPYENLKITADEGSPTVVSVRKAGDLFKQVSIYDYTLPDITPQAAPEGRLSATLQRGFSYELFHRDSSESPFSFDSDLGISVGASFQKIVPYEDTFTEGAFRLDGLQVFRRFAAPTSDFTTSLNGAVLNSLSAFGDTLAIGTTDVSTNSKRVDVLDLATGAIRFSIENVNGPIAVNEHHVVAETRWGSGTFVLSDARTGASSILALPNSNLQTRIALSGDRLVTTSAHSFYNSGAYLHVARVNIHSLPDGRNLYSLPFATKTSSLSWDIPPLDLVVAGDSIIVRTVPDGSPYADAGRVRIIDLDTFETRYELASPAPEPGDVFGAWLAAAGDWLAVGAAGTSEVFVYDLPTGELRHTLVLPDRPEGVENNSTATARLSIDAVHNRLAWFVNDDPDAAGNLVLSGATAIYLFDLGTGLVQAKVLPEASGASAVNTRWTGATLADGRLVVANKLGQALAHPLDEALAVPLETNSEILAASPTIRLEFPTRRGVSYQPEVSSDEGATWTALGAKHYGNGTPATLRRSIAGLPAPESLRFRLRTAWESSPAGLGSAL